MPENLVTLFPDDVGVEIPAGLFGHMLEITGRCVYDGVWVGEDSPIPNDDGLRLDTIEAYRQLKVSNMRLGGAAGEYYHWQDGIGPRDQRRRSRNIFWGGYDSNHFGTDEFLRFCAAIGAEPILQVNVATGSRREALDWMEYCNASPPSELARIRAQNGHPEPYGVEYWQIGNENLILHAPEEYGREVRRFGTYMRQAELDAKLIVRGTWNLESDYNQRLLEYIGDQHYLIDLLSLHCYTYPPPLANPGEFDTYEVMAGAELVEKQILRAAAALDLYAAGKKQIGIIVDEYGTHHNETLFGNFPIREVPNGLEQPSFQRDAILAARVLHVFMRHADRVAVANLSTSINVLHTALKTDGSTLIRTPTYHALDMLKEHMSARSIRIKNEAGYFEFGEDSSTHSAPDPDLYTSGDAGTADADDAGNGVRTVLPNLDVVASATPGGHKVLISIINPNVDSTVDFRLAVQGTSCYSIGAGSASVLKAAGPLEENDSEQPDRIRPSAVSVQERPDGWAISCAPLSLTVLTLMRDAEPA